MAALLYLFKRQYLTIFIVSLSIFFAHVSFTKTALYSDTRFYWVITRSLVKDHDINFLNEYTTLGIDPTKTKTGLYWNKYPPGSSLFWIPSYSLADGFAHMLSLSCYQKIIGVCIKVDTLGYGIIYQTAAAFASIMLGVLGLYIVSLSLERFFDKTTSRLVVVGLFAATNLLFYMGVEPLTSHPISFFISSLFIYYFLQPKKGMHHYLVLGIIGGIAATTRTQDAAILLLPVLEVALVKPRKIIKIANKLFPLSTGFLVGFLPQIYFWWKIFGTLWFSPYIKEGFHFLRPEILHVLFNGQNGLFTITPVIALSVIGLIIIVKKHSQQMFISKLALLYFALQLYLISSWSSYSQGGSYSIRMIVTTYPLLAFGLAEVVRKTNIKFGLNKTLLLITFFSGINAALIVRYLLLF